MKIEIQPASLEDKTILRNLMELYAYDFSEFEQSDVDEHGLFGYERLDHYWTEAGRYPFLVRAHGRLAGFVLVRNLEETTPVHSIAEFFILRKYRRRGVGKAAAHQIFGMFPGQWRVAQTEDNHPAQAFWRKVISGYTQGNFKEIWSNDDEWKGPIQIFGTESAAISKLPMT
ncbi:MAG: GNAT family N-acetyltransferase [Anaerolineales bacterium]|nr:GNAT family N-acetyltransferase [Anaerolineales bacterium]